MITIQTYECPHHGHFEATVLDAPDLCDCPHTDLDGGTFPVTCATPSQWRPSAPAVHTPGSAQRALTGHVRDVNPW